jgi:hypothetical protein
MTRKSLLVFIALSLMVLVGSEQLAQAQSSLTTQEVVDKNVAARGGLQAWRAVQTMSLSGKMPAGGNRRSTLAIPTPDQGKGKMATPPRPTDEVELPFVMELKRPNKVRIEIEFKGQTAVQVYDGKNGWKLRPFLGRNEVEPYTAEEAKAAGTQTDLDGLLIDYAAKGSKVESEGTEKVEGRDCYKLKVTLKNGNVLHVWVDAKTFLDAKAEGQPRMLDGAYHPVEVYYRDYRAVNGLQIPFLLETRVLPVRTPQGHSSAPVPAEKTTIEKVEINPKLDDALFTRASLEASAKATPKK